MTKKVSAPAPETFSLVGAEKVGTRPTRKEAEDAVRTLLRWTGDDPDREGLRAPPARRGPPVFAWVMW